MQHAVGEAPSLPATHSPHPALVPVPPLFLPPPTAQRLRESGIDAATWDRQGKKYHGRVKAFIEALNESGVRLSEDPELREPAPLPVASAPA